jgi:hypothetical protein
MPAGWHRPWRCYAFGLLEIWLPGAPSRHIGASISWRPISPILAGQVFFDTSKTQQLSSRHTIYPRPKYFRRSRSDNQISASLKIRKASRRKLQETTFRLAAFWRRCWHKEAGRSTRRCFAEPVPEEDIEASATARPAQQESGPGAADRSACIGGHGTEP